MRIASLLMLCSLATVACGRSETGPQPSESPAVTAKSDAAADASCACKENIRELPSPTPADNCVNLELPAVSPVECGAFVWTSQTILTPTPHGELEFTYLSADGRRVTACGTPGSYRAFAVSRGCGCSMKTILIARANEPNPRE